MASFFDAIDSNKRNSAGLLLLSFFIFLGVALAASSVLGIGDFGFGIFALIGIGYMVIAYFFGDKFVLSMSGAKEATHDKYPFLYDIIEGMALASGIPMPKVYIIDDPSPNAFATGSDPKKASVAVTTGLLKTMNRQELEGVVAHEMSHIGNFDIRFMLYAVVMVGAIALISNMVSRTFIFGGGRSDRKGGGGVLVIIALVFMVLAPIFAELVRLAISRQREFLADATAAKITRYPEGLASALEKLSKNTVPVKGANDATAPLYIVNPFVGGFGHIFSTHPKIEDRVKRLRGM
ncbi:MAG: M48 family metalloprotease [Candidatus Micrarchaeia archaeon]